MLATQSDCVLCGRWKKGENKTNNLTVVNENRQLKVTVYYAGGGKLGAK